MGRSGPRGFSGIWELETFCAWVPLSAFQVLASPSRKKKKKEFLSMLFRNYVLKLCYPAFAAYCGDAFYYSDFFQLVNLIFGSSCDTGNYCMFAKCSVMPVYSLKLPLKNLVFIKVI